MHMGTGQMRSVRFGNKPGTVLGGSWRLSKYVNIGDNWDYYMAYRGY